MINLLKKAATLSALCLSAHVAFGAGVQFDEASKTASFDCHRMVIPEKSYLTVNVTHDQQRGVYVYQYTLRTSDPKSPSVNGVLFKDLADNKSTSTFKGARPCMTGPGRAVCSGGSSSMVNGEAGPITLESAAEPGVVRYSLIGDVRAGLSNEDARLLATRYGGDQDEAMNDVEDAMSEACPYSRAASTFERGMTGTIIGPSGVAMIDASVAVAAKSAQRSVELKSSASSAARIENVKPESIVVTDSRLLPVQTGRAALERAADKSQVLRLDWNQKSVPCNVRGVVVRGSLLDGTPVAGSFDVEPPACASKPDRASIQLPSG